LFWVRQPLVVGFAAADSDGSDNDLERLLSLG
jgi:hypothetical protein